MVINGNINVDDLDKFNLRKIHQMTLTEESRISLPIIAKRDEKCAWPLLLV